MISKLHIIQTAVIVLTLFTTTIRSFHYKNPLISSRLVSSTLQHERSHEIFQLYSQSSAVAEAPIQKNDINDNNKNDENSNNINFKIVKADSVDLSAIVSLRVNVFYPDVSHKLSVI